MPKICAKCGALKDISEFGTDHRTQCKQCLARKARAWRVRNPTKVRKMAITYYATHREKILTKHRGNKEHRTAYMQEYRNTHAEKLQKYSQEYTRAYRQKYGAELSAKNKKWVLANHERRKISNRMWHTKNPHASQQIRQRRRALKQSLPSTLTATEIQFCRQYFHYACAVCGREEGFQWTIALDHWIPLIAPECPGTVASNIIPLCHGIQGCNNMKKAQEASAWVTATFGKQKARIILKRIQQYFYMILQRSCNSDPT